MLYRLIAKINQLLYINKSMFSSANIRAPIKD